jgi:hypothetical protein
LEWLDVFRRGRAVSEIAFQRWHGASLELE